MTRWCECWSLAFLRSPLVRSKPHVAPRQGAWPTDVVDTELRFSPGRQSSAVLLPPAHQWPRAEAPSQVGSLTAGCGDKIGDWLSQFAWAAMMGVTLG